MSRRSVVAALLVGCVLSAGAGKAATIEVVLSKIPGHPTAAVPDALNLAGQPEFTEFSRLDVLMMSPDGSQWMVAALTTSGVGSTTNRDAVVVKGSGLGRSVFLQEGQPAPFGNTADYISFFGSGAVSAFGGFNGNNEVCVSIRARTVQDGTAASPLSADGARVLRWTPGEGFRLAYKEGQIYFGGSGGVVGSAHSSYHLLNDGRVGSVDTTVNGTSAVQYLFYNTPAGMNQVFKQRDVSPVLDVDGVTTLTCGTFSTSDVYQFHTTPDGTHYCFKGGVTGASGVSGVAWVYDGQVRLRAGVAIAGASPATVVGDIISGACAGNHWIARGRDNSSTAASAPDYAVVDGVMVARSTLPITPGSTERWGSTFSAASINANGDYIVQGVTTNPDLLRDNVIVLNGTTVLVREGDRVDLNGNGLEDDDAYVGRAAGSAFDGLDAYITDDGMVHFIGYLRNAAGLDLTGSGAQALMRVRAVAGGCLGGCGTSDFNGDGDFGTDADIEGFFACLGGNCCGSCFCGGSDFNGDGDFGTDQDIESFFRVLAGGAC